MPDTVLADPTGRSNMRLLIQLRWIAVIGQVATIAVVVLVLDVPLPLAPMILVLACLVVFNLVRQARYIRGVQVSASELLLALLVDVAVLTAQLYFSGGPANPFLYLYLLQITLGGVLLPPRQSWTLLAIAIACALLVTVWHQPLQWSVDGAMALRLYVTGLLLCLLLNAVLLLVFLTRINRNQRDQDAYLAQLRERAVEEEHIVRMGLLASGAAHELSTPLSTLSVILGDWRHMEPFISDAERAQEVDDMQTQVARCKTIVQGILRSSGETRGVAPAATTIAAFLQELVDAWRRTRPETALDFENRIWPDREILSDLAMRQMIENILDNAREASPAWVELVATIDVAAGAHDRRVAEQGGQEAEQLVLTVTDRGPGFRPAMLTTIGKPYHSTKGRPGAGLGLFLAVNVARVLGGRIEAGNRAKGGAVVRIILPLSVIALDGDGLAPELSRSGLAAGGSGGRKRQRAE